MSLKWSGYPTHFRRVALEESGDEVGQLLADPLVAHGEELEDVVQDFLGVVKVVQLFEESDESGDEDDVELLVGVLGVGRRGLGGFW